MQTVAPVWLLLSAVLVEGAVQTDKKDGVSPQRQAYERTLEEPNGPLNPHGYPRLNPCEHISLDDPVAKAKENISKGDLRPFKIYGFMSPLAQRAPGIICLTKLPWPYDYRGGYLGSDMPVCGGELSSTSNAPTDEMEAYNRVLAADHRFQEITACNPAPLTPKH